MTLPRFYKILSIVLAAVCLFSSFVSVSYAWQSVGQSVKNEFRELEEKTAEVELLKLEKLTDGTLTDNALKDAVFYLFRLEEKDGETTEEQIGVQYVTDKDGKISVELPSGDYYFLEVTPTSGYTFDTDENGKIINKYDFTVKEDETEKVTVKAYNVPVRGTLSISKTVENADKSELTEQQLDTEFEFKVTFSDDGTYTYKIGKTEKSLKSGETLKLKHGETAVFEDIPEGISYKAEEINIPPNYTVSGTAQRGAVTADGAAASFVNTYKPIYTSLTVTKEVKGGDTDREFEFTAKLGDETETFTLKDGESKTFKNILAGTPYTVTEKETDGYIAEVKKYKGIIPSDGEAVTLPFVNVLIDTPNDGTGSLEISKTVIVTDDTDTDNDSDSDSDSDTDSDFDSEFTFKVEFSDDEAYAYSLNGKKYNLKSGETLMLKHGETARFDNLPAGITYKITETDFGEYTPAFTSSNGIIIKDNTSKAEFINYAEDTPSEITLRVTKKIEGEIPEKDKGREFTFILTVDGEKTEFTLKDGETSEDFEIPPNVSYSVCEKNYLSEGYAQSTTTNYTRKGDKLLVKVKTVNRYTRVITKDISGVKTWSLGKHDVKLPESITVLLKNGDFTVDKMTVKPDANGDWRYTFTAPKYDDSGKEIEYTVEESPVKHFKAVYSDYDIENVYIPPITVELPKVKKIVKGKKAPKNAVFEFLLRGEDGTPMPAGSTDGTATLSMKGAGEKSFPKITFDKAGVYTYTVSELNRKESGWVYDSAKYVFVVTVTEKDGVLKAEKVLVKGNDTAKKLEFTNSYAPPGNKPDTVVIRGEKKWVDNNNSTGKRPDSIVVYIYADGELIRRKMVSAADNWKYTLELPRLNDGGKEIAYTVNEKAVKDYTTKVDGYNLVNTYTPGSSGKPGKTDGNTPNRGGINPKTGDDSNIALWISLMIASFIGLCVCGVLWIRARNRSRYVGKYFKK